VAESYVQVSTTTDSRAEAGRLAELVVERRLAACAQILGPMHSTYRWKDAVESADEWLVLMKTVGRHTETLMSLLKDEHGYETPDIVATPILTGHPAYLRWIAEETEPEGPGSETQS